MKSWKTTAAAIIGALTIVLTQVGAMIDGNAETVANWNAVAGSLVACAGLMFAKDDSKAA